MEHNKWSFLTRLAEKLPTILIAGGFFFLCYNVPGADVKNVIKLILDDEFARFIGEEIACGLSAVMILTLYFWNRTK